MRAYLFAPEKGDQVMPKPILLIEDDLVYARLVRDALKELDAPNELVHVTEGKAA